ncbi:MAG: hypothetical protein C0601_00675 [Candidatus Muiribacterium halophilum]|uniref:Lipoprotein n=1 Tax=Muiribacterium halophilum TaxID=2053465 RepID=A0A2N5ZML2_MUIH1|nr:MAG: hypothetical protein C0601_00675 [Candidatus Muirbacterium halophilum]
MKRLITLFLLLLTMAVFACPNYQLAELSAAELKVEFDTVKTSIENDFDKLDSDFGSHSYKDFKRLISDWMTLYTKYECWFEVSENGTAKVKIDKERSYMDRLKKVSTVLGKGIDHFIAKDYSRALREVRDARVIFNTEIKGNTFTWEREFLSNLAKLIKTKNSQGLRSFNRENKKKINTLLDVLDKNAKKYGVVEYKNKAESFYRKLSNTIDNQENIDYIVDELNRLVGEYNIYRMQNSDKLMKFWVEVK